MTYSLAVTGSPVENPQRPLRLTVDDSVATPGNQARACMTGEEFLCRGQDGQQGWYRYDTELTVPGVRRVLVRVR